MAGWGQTLVVVGVQVGGRDFLERRSAAKSDILSLSLRAFVRAQLGAVQPSAPQRMHRQLAPSYSFLRDGTLHDQNMFNQRLSAWSASDWRMTIC